LRDLLALFAEAFTAAEALGMGVGAECAGADQHRKGEDQIFLHIKAPVDKANMEV